MPTRAARAWRWVAAVVLAGCSNADSSTSPVGADDLYWFAVGKADTSVVERVYDGYFTRQQAFIKSCMEQAGFDYNSGKPESQYALPPGADLDPQAYAARYGLGISAFVGAGTPAPQLVGDDPNGALLADMSPSAQSRWFDHENLCLERAYVESPLYGDTRQISLLIDDLIARVRLDPRVIAAESAWSRCMAEAGYEFPDRGSMIRSFEHRTQELVAVGADAEGSGRHHELDRLRDLEFRVAAADSGCRGPRDEAERGVLEELRITFTAQHETALVP